MALMNPGNGRFLLGIDVRAVTGILRDAVKLVTTTGSDEEFESCYPALGDFFQLLVDAVKAPGEKVEGSIGA